jgi:hypothetical protein
MPQDWTRQLQSSEEASKNVITQNDTWKNIGIVNKLDDSKVNTHEEIPILSGEDIHDDVQLELADSFTMGWLVFDTRFLRYCTEPRGGSGTIAKTNTLLRSQLIDNAQRTRIYTGVMCDRITLNLDKLIQANGTFKTLNATSWLDDTAVTALIGGTPVFAPALVSGPWTHRSNAVADPVTYGGSARDIQKGTLDISRNVYQQYPWGDLRPANERAGGRRITFSFDTWVKDGNLLGDVDGMTAKAIVIRLYTTPINITLTSCKFNTHTMSSDSGSNEATMERMIGTAKAVTIDPLTVAA